jgi:subtilisin family serine protease
VRELLLACIAVAAVLAVSPVLAQKQPSPGAAAIDPAGKDHDTGSADSAKDRNSIECFDSKPATGATLDPNCVKAEILDPRFPGRVVVTLPDILVDLFGGSFTATGGGISEPAGGSGAVIDPGGAAPAPQADPSNSGGSNASSSALVVQTAGPRLPVVSPRAVAGAFVPDEVLVTIDGDAAAVQDIATNFGLDVRSQRVSNLLGVIVVRFGIPDGRQVSTVLAQLAVDPRTRERVPNHIYVLQQASAIVNYAFKRISLDSDAASGADVDIAVIDTAVDAKHPALAGVIAEEYDAMPDVAQADRDHGTSVAGLIAGIGPFHGMAPGSAIYHARAFEGGKSTMDVILDALDWAAAKPVRIVNMSFVGPDNDLLKAACANARARGLILVAAAGNNGPKAPYGYPAAYPGVIAVTATDADDRLMPQANRGPYVYVSAPGVDMLAPVDGGNDAVTGTSFAAAIVSGAIANLLHDNPEHTAEWVEKALAETSSDLGAKGRDADFGYGLVNAKAALGLGR